MTRMIRMYLRQVVAAAVICLVAAPAAYADLAVQHASTVVTETAGNGNGVAEPGDTVALTENVMSLEFDPLTGVSGTLATTSADATVGSASSAYADLVFGVPTGNTDPYSVSLASSMECGVAVPFTVTLQTSAGNADVPFMLPTGSAGPFGSYESSDVPRSIPDGDATGYSSDLTIGGSGARVKGVRVRVGHITHTYDGDLTLTLISPDGRSVTLVSGKGGSGDDFVDTVFDDAATSTIRSTTTAPFTGTFKPAQPLSALDGAPLNGSWTLKVVDGASGDIGTLDAWGLDLSAAVCDPQPQPESPPPPPPPPPHDCGQGNGVGNGKTKPPKAQHDCPTKQI
jgi:subtilisin-like proprotein convertase family protein